MLQNSIGSPQELRRNRCEIAAQRVCALTALFNGERRRVVGSGILAFFALS
jgi:hypothetical protein